MNTDESFHPTEHIQNHGEMSLEMKELILKERAQRIARVQAKDNKEHTTTEVVIFTLEKERYAIEATYIKEVYPLIDVTVLPCVPPWVYGVINVRRKIYSVVDLQNLFGLVQQEDSAEKKVIILENKNNSFGILTDEIIGVTSIDLSELQSQLPTQTHHSKEYFKGITNDRVIVLNGDKLLNSESLVVDEVVIPK